MLYPRLKKMLESELRGMGLDIPVIGYLPESPCFRMESRHLGLVTPQELDGLKAQMKRAGELLSRTVDLELVRQIAEKAARSMKKEPDTAAEKALVGSAEKALAGSAEKALRIGVARDEAFCFYYKDNLTLLEDLGCTLIPFSPLRDSALPEGLDGLLLGGGYPELHGEELVGNTGMISSVREALEAGMPCLAECGGFMYLHEEMEDRNGKKWPLVGAIRGRTYPTGKLVRFGYVKIENSAGTEGYLQPGEYVRGHEFHYWDSTDSGSDCLAVKPDGRRKWNCIHMDGSLFAGYPHLYLPSMRKFAERFVRQCREWEEKEL